MATKMKWYNLLNNKCPKCDKGDLNASMFSKTVILCNLCNFKISEQRMKEVIFDVQKERHQKRGDMIVTEALENGATVGYAPTNNFEALQNLGHEEVAEDFSDSSALDY